MTCPQCAGAGDPLPRRRNGSVEMSESPALRLVDSDDPITLGDMIDLEEAMVEE